MQRLEQSQIFSNGGKQQKNPIKNKSAIKINQKCIGGKLLHSFCFNKKCQIKQKFVCLDEICQCNQKHQFCQKGQIKVVIKKINQKLTENSMELKLMITDTFTKLIDKISEFQQILLKQVNNDLKKFIQISDLQKKFLQLFVHQKSQILNFFDGPKLLNLWQVIDENNKSNKQTLQIFTNYLQKIKIYQRSCQVNIQSTKKYLNDMITNFKDQKQKPPLPNLKKSINSSIISKTQHLRTQSTIPNQSFLRQRKVQKSLPKIQRPLSNYNNYNSTNPLLSILSRSSILTNQQQLLTLQNLFHLKLKKLTLMFKASQFNFQIRKYEQRCGDIKDTMLLVQTTKNKIIGAYTPLALYQINQKSGLGTDYSNSSFVFSLTNGDRFDLKVNRQAVYKRSKQQRICFGGLLDIENIPGNNKFGRSNFGAGVYVNQKYKNNQESCVMFNGNLNMEFQIKQWEVYKVQTELSDQFLS